MSVENIRKTADKPLKLSIIMPIYNTEPWLARCLDSLTGQTLKDNFEIIYIDDKSPDNSLKLLREHKKKDNRIRVVVREKTAVSRPPITQGWRPRLVNILGSLTHRFSLIAFADQM